MQFLFTTNFLSQGQLWADIQWFQPSVADVNSDVVGDSQCQQREQPFTITKHHLPDARQQQDSLQQQTEIRVTGTEDGVCEFGTYIFSGVKWYLMNLLEMTVIYDINSLWPNDSIWWHRSGSPLTQVMACCLMAPSHYLNQCWLIISEVFWHPPEGNFTGNVQAIYSWYEFENY